MCQIARRSIGCPRHMRQIQKTPRHQRLVFPSSGALTHFHRYWRAGATDWVRPPQSTSCRLQSLGTAATLGFLAIRNDPSTIWTWSANLVDSLYHSMHYQAAQSCLKLLKQSRGVTPSSVPFVTPIQSVLRAAGTVSPQFQGQLRNVVFSSDADQYARTTGLKDVLEGTYRFPQRGGLEGRTYSKLARLSSHAEVDRCNAVIGDLIHHQLAKSSPNSVQEFSKVVAELHDNRVHEACEAEQPEHSEIEELGRRLGL